MTNKVILITGTNSGFGYLTAKGAAERGHTVYATMRDTQGRNKERANELQAVENINVIWNKSIAFVRYRQRISAEFAKEAMANQALDDEEILMVRWAYDDSNKVAQQAIKRSNEDAMYAAMRAQGAGPLAAPEGQGALVGPVAKKQRR